MKLQKAIFIISILTIIISCSKEDSENCEEKIVGSYTGTMNTITTQDEHELIPIALEVSYSNEIVSFNSSIFSSFEGVVIGDCAVDIVTEDFDSLTLVNGSFARYSSGQLQGTLHFTDNRVEFETRIGYNVLVDPQ